ncbi:hypothetical protein [Anoxynatronum buryatiense]|uniref:Lipoprotein n=1 Tax=Anoxynatronum buryatiense TaxID=489973 RepID=A0AA45WSJ2_9CLOT|nr:hypothetical protein [Anoxynatronum buryatiense]SMP38275.1 hypothetical protein SAMN06296020_10174 [Anoxynatronum buryatiense]
MGKRLLIMLVLCFVLVGGGCSNEFKNKLDEGKGAYEAENFIMAIIHFEEALLIKPGDEEAKQLLEMSESKLKVLLDELEKAQLELDLINYFGNLYSAHYSFIEYLQLASTDDDVDQLLKLKRDLNIKSPAAIVDYHRQYLSAMDEIYDAHLEYIRGVERQDHNQIREASNKLGDSVRSFELYIRDMEAYFIKNQMTKEQVAFPW